MNYNLTYCESDRKPTGEEKLFKTIIGDLRRNPDFFKQDFVVIDGDCLCYHVRFAILFNNQKYEVELSYGTISEIGEMTIKAKNKIIDWDNLPDDIITMVWNEGVARLPPDDLDDLLFG